VPVRVPACWNDLVGLKTTAGRVSLTGVVPLCSSFDTVGPLCRSVEDAALLLAALEGRRAPDLRGATLDGVRFAVLRTVAMEDLRDQPAAGFKSAVGRLQAAGAVIESVDVPEVEEAMALSAILYTTEAYAEWREVIEANPDVMFSEILERFRAGGRFSAVDFIQAWQHLEAWRHAYYGKTAGFDAVIVPSTPNMPPNLERLASDHDYYVTENLLTLRNTRIGNLMGLAGLTVPTGLPSTGITLLTPPMSEDRLLRLGAAAEAALA